MIIDNKGFSMIELLATVAILSILSSIGLIAVSNILEKAHREYYKNQEKNLVLAAQSYMNANKSELPKVVGKKEKVTAKELKDANYLKKDITRYDGKTKCNEEKTYVNVFRYGTSDYSYTAYLTCPDDKVAAEEEKKEQPYIDAVFPGSSEDVSTASIKISFKGEKNDSETKLLSYSYSLFVMENGKSVELLNTGTMQVRQSSVDKTISLSKYTISGNASLKIKATATNMKGNSISQTFTNNYSDKTPPKCEYPNKADDPKGEFRRKIWVNRDVKVTIGCNDNNGSGCEKDTYTKTFTTNGGIDYIRISDNVGNKRNCPVVKFIDKSAPTVKVNVYKCDSKHNATGSVLKTYTASGNTVEVKSSDLSGNVNGWLNKANYPYGVCFAFNVQDASSLKTKSWKWNKAGHKKNGKDYTSLDGGSSNNTYAIDDGYNLTNNKKYNHSLSGEGHRYAEFIAEDGIGNKSILKFNILIDRTKPTVPIVTGYKKKSSASPNDEKGLAGYTFDTWYSGWVLTKASGSTDEISGVAAYYLTTTGQKDDVTDSKQVYRNVNVDEKKVTIKYRAKDVAGNFSDYTTKIVKLDRTAPKIVVNAYKCDSNKKPTGKSLKKLTTNESNTLSSSDVKNNVNGWLNKEKYPTGICFKFSITDGVMIVYKDWQYNDSGFKKNEKGYNTFTKEKKETFADYETKKLSDTKSISGEGHRYARMTFKDKAGNTSKMILNMLIDRTKPTVPVINGYEKKNGNNIASESGLSSYTFDTWYKGWVLTKASDSTDEISGVEGYYLTTKGQEKDADDSKQVYRNINVSEGIVTVKYRAMDKAGNYSSYTTVKVRLDRVGPTIPTVKGYKKNNSSGVDCDKVTSLEKYSDGSWYNGYVITRASGSRDGGAGGVDYYLTTTGQSSNKNDSKQQCRNTNGAGTIKNKYKACDKLGNCSNYKVFSINIDKTAPTIDYSNDVSCETLSSGLSFWGKTTYIDMNDEGGSGLSQSGSSITMIQDYDQYCYSNSGRGHDYTDDISTGSKSSTHSSTCFCGGQGFTCDYKAYVCDRAGNCTENNQTTYLTQASGEC